MDCSIYPDLYVKLTLCFQSRQLLIFLINVVKTKEVYTYRTASRTIYLFHPYHLLQHSRGPPVNNSSRKKRDNIMILDL